MTYKMKGHAQPGINQRGNENLEDGRAKSSAFQKNEGIQSPNKHYDGLGNIGHSHDSNTTAKPDAIRDPGKKATPNKKSAPFKNYKKGYYDV